MLLPPLLLSLVVCSMVPCVCALLEADCTGLTVGFVVCSYRNLAGTSLNGSIPQSFCSLDVSSYCRVCLRPVHACLDAA